jgi:integrase
VQYIALCDRMAVQAYPVSKSAIAVYIAFLVDNGVQAQSIPAYLSAIFKRQTLEGTPIDATVQDYAHLLTKGAANQQVSRRGPAQKEIISANTCKIMAECLLQQCSSLQVKQQRELAAVIFGFLFALRADTICSVMPGDVILRDKNIIFTERKWKSKQVQRQRTRTSPVQGKMASAIAKYINWTSSSSSFETSLFGFRQQGASAAKVVSYINIAATTAKIKHNQTISTAHALRRGAAVSMSAVGVPSVRLCDWGGWAGEASVRPYLKDHPWTTPTPDDFDAFGWMHSLHSLQ